MSTQTIIYKVCNGCGRDTITHHITIIKTLDYFAIPVAGNPTIDICDMCDGAGKYICRHCRKVHDDEHACETVKAFLETQADLQQYISDQPELEHIPF